jgi:oxalate decarboxylase/phosphoglucose isomerase-like protein (cupin superfamily)
MDFGFKTEELGENLIIHFKKDVLGWKRFASEMVDDGVILDTKNAKRMIETKGDLIVYEVYHLWKSIDKIKRISERTGIACDITFLNSGVFSPSDDGELFITYGHLHEKPMGEAYTVLKNECFFVLADGKSWKTYIVLLKEGDSILIHPKYLHRIGSLRKDCLVVAFLPDKAGHNYEVVKNKGFPFHVFYKKKKLKIVKNKKYRSGNFEIVKKSTCKIDPVKLFEKNPRKLKDILENPEKYKKLYFMGR